MRDHKDLDVWRISMSWVEAVYEASARWPSEERYGLISQVRRSAVSVPANISEGAARHGTREFVHFLGIARASLAEAETLLILAGRLGYSPGETIGKLLEEQNRIARMLSGLVAALRSR